jgi:hypothetical protein
MATSHAHTPRWIEYHPVDSLPDHPDNPRVHDLDDLMASVRRFGFTTPMVLDGRTGLLAEGHGRKKATIALRDAGRPADLPDGAPWPPQGIHVDEDGAWRVPVVQGWASVDDTEARAALLGTNLPGTWDDAVLAKLLGDLAATESGLTGTGFDDDDLARLLAEVPDFAPSSGDDQPRLDRKFHLVCAKCGSPVDPASADKIDL